MIVKIKNIKFKIRPCKNNDYRFCYNIAKRNMKPYLDKYWGGWIPKNFRNHFKDSNVRIIQRLNKRIGYMDFEFKEDFLYINNIQISTTYRNKGLGSALINLLGNEAKKENIKKIRLKVFKDNPAIGLYKRIGFKKIKDDKSAVILEKHI